jgi:hypothetical protein
MTLDILNIHIMHLVERFEESSDGGENQSACMWERIYVYCTTQGELFYSVVCLCTYILDNWLCMFPQCIMRVGV